MLFIKKKNQLNPYWGWMWFCYTLDSFVFIKHDIICMPNSVCCSAVVSIRPHGAQDFELKEDIWITFPV